MNTSISILTEIPEILHESLVQYLDDHPTWDQDRVFAVALSLFLLQNESNSQDSSSNAYDTCARVYLETLFNNPSFNKAKHWEDIVIVYPSKVFPVFRVIVYDQRKKIQASDFQSFGFIHNVNPKSKTRLHEAKGGGR